MATITTINAADQITNSRSDINTNFTNLNTDKIETSVIDTDTSLAANSDAKIPSQKAVKAYVDANSILTVSSETSTSTTYSLTTTASQRVWVMATGTIIGDTNAMDVVLKYNGVTKQTQTVRTGNAGFGAAFALQYTETPGAATADITLTTASGGTIGEVKIVVLKFNV